MFDKIDRFIYHWTGIDGRDPYIPKDFGVNGWVFNKSKREWEWKPYMQWHAMERWVSDRLFFIKRRLMESLTKVFN